MKNGPTPAVRSVQHRGEHVRTVLVSSNHVADFQGFYLITTDILGPYGVGYAMGTLGWGPGIALYTVFGFMAGYSGYLIWHTFSVLTPTSSRSGIMAILRSELGVRRHGMWSISCKPSRCFWFWVRLLLCLDRTYRRSPNFASVIPSAHCCSCLPASLSHRSGL